MFSYENKTKINFENKENEFTIFNILYMNQKTGKSSFPCFRIKFNQIQSNGVENENVFLTKFKYETYFLKMKTKY